MTNKLFDIYSYLPQSVYIVQFSMVLENLFAIVCLYSPGLLGTCRCYLPMLLACRYGLVFILLLRIYTDKQRDIQIVKFNTNFSSHFKQLIESTKVVQDKPLLDIHKINRGSVMSLLQNFESIEDQTFRLHVSTEIHLQ